MAIVVRPYKRKGKEAGLHVDIRIRMPDGTMYRERVKSPVSGKGNTERWAQARERELFTKGLVPKVVEAPKVKTLKEFWPTFLEDHVVANGQKPSGKESKEYGYRRFLEPRFGDTPLSEVSTEAVAAWKSQLVTEGYAPATINNQLALLSKVLNFAVDVGVLDHVPCKIQKLKKQVPATLSYEHDEYERLVAAARCLSADHYLLILLGGDAGLRKGEIVALLQRNCDTRKGVITVERSQWRHHVAGTKGLAVRHIKMTDRLRAALKAHRHLRGEGVFHHDDGSPVTGNTLRRWAEQAQKAAGIGGGRGGLHILRHSWCTHLVAGGVPVTTVQRLAGHQSLTTTSRYLHALDGETERAIRMLQESRGSGLATPSQTGSFAED